MIGRRDYALRMALAFAAMVAALLAFGAPAAQAQNPLAPVDVGLTISDNPDPVQTNDPNFQYSFEVRNLTNTNIAYAVQVVFDIPHHTSLPSIPNDCYQPAGDKLVCNMGPIEPGGVRSRNIPLKHLLNGPINFQGTANAANQPDFVPGNNTDFETTTVTGTQAPSWTVSVQRFGHGTVRGHGISCGVDFNPGLDCSEPFSEGGTATLRANDAENFIGWGGDCAFAGSDPICSLPVTGNDDVEAHFVETPAQPPTASLNIDSEGNSIEPREMFFFNASGVSNANFIKYAIDPPGPGGFSGGFTTSPTTPYTGLRLTTPGTYKVIQTVTGPSGEATSSQSVKVINGPGFVGKPPLSVAFSSSDQNRIPPGAPATQACIASSQLVVGLVEAEGCFRHTVDPADLPEAERGVSREGNDLNSVFAFLGLGSCRNQVPLSATCSEAAAQQGIDMYYTTQSVRLNGMTVDPVGDAGVVVYPSIGKVISSNATVSLYSRDLGSIPAHLGPLNLDVGTGDFTTPTRKSLSLWSFNASQLPDLGGFKIDGQMTLALAQEGDRRFSELAVNMTLPVEFSTSADTRPSGGVKLQATNAEGLVLQNLDIDIPEAFLGGVRLSALKFAYKRAGNDVDNPGSSQYCTRRWWKAEARINLIPTDGNRAAGLSLAPPPARNGVAFCAGGFHSGGGDFTFGQPPDFLPAPQIFPGVELYQIGFNMQLEDPTVFSGQVSVQAAKIADATGGLLFAAARPDAPYTIKAEDAGNTMGPLAGKTLIKPSLAVGGDLSMILPGNNNLLRLGGATFLYSYPNYIKADGFARINTFLYTINASGGLELNTATERFDAYATGQACLLGGITFAGQGACAGATARVSSKGMSVCADVLGIQPGIGYAWGETFPTPYTGILGGGCKPSKYWEVNIENGQRMARRMAPPQGSLVPARGGSGTDPIAFTVKPGDTTKDFRVHGVGGAPAVQIEAPDGEIITSVPNEMNGGDNLQTLAWEEHDFTWVGVTNGEPGEYLVTPLNGSVPIKEAYETRPTPDEGITATVESTRRGGDEQVLRYDIGKDPGQKVTFIERGDEIWEQIGTATEQKGTIPFEPGLAPEGEREIIAQVEVDGLPGPIETLDTYDAPPPPEAGSTDRVKVKRKGKKLNISWKAAPEATDYMVVVTQDNGVQATKILSAKKRKLKVGGISPIEGGTVAVSGLGPLGDVGSEDETTFKAIKKKPDRRIPFDQLGEG